MPAPPKSTITLEGPRRIVGTINVQIPDRSRVVKKGELTAAEALAPRVKPAPKSLAARQKWAGPRPVDTWFPRPQTP